MINQTNRDKQCLHLSMGLRFPFKPNKPYAHDLKRKIISRLRS